MTLQNAFGNLALDATVASTTSLANSFTTSGNTAAVTLGNRETLGIQVVGATPGTIVIEGTVDGTNWITLTGGILNQASLAWQSTITAAGSYVVGVAGFVQARARMSVTGTATVSLVATQASSTVGIDAALPAGTNLIGSVKLTDGTNTAAVKGSSAAAVAGDSALVVTFSPNTPLPTGNNTIGSVSLVGGNNGVGNVGHSASSAISGNIVANAGAIDGSTDLTSYASVRVQVTGTWVGTLTFQVSNDGTNWFSKALNNSSGAIETSQTTNGMHSGNLGARYFRVVATAWTSGTAAVVLVYSAATEDVASVAFANNPTYPDGSQTVDTGSHSLFMDPFDSAPVGTWTVAGTTNPTASGGQAVLSLATTASASSYMTTGNATFYLYAQMAYKVAFGVTYEATPTTNNARWWGIGIQAGSPTAAAPITNGAVFMLDPTAGALIGAIYSAGTRTKTVSLTRQSDGAAHRYQIYYRQSVVYWEIDGAVVGSATWPNLAQSSTLKLIVGTFNATSAASQATTFTLNYASLGDTGGNGVAISGGDPITGYLRAGVTRPNVAALASESGLIVSLHPTSALPTGTNAIGSVTANITDLSTSGSLVTTDIVVAAPTGAGGLLTGTPTAGSSAAQNLNSPTSIAYSTTDIQLSGTFGGGTVYFEGTEDFGTNWITIPVIPLGTLSPVPTISATAAGVFRGSWAGMTNFRVRIVGATSPNVSVNARFTLGQSVMTPNVSISGNPLLLVTAASTNATSVRTVPTSLYELTISNPTATAAYVKLYNKASAPTVGTDVPVATYRVAATGSAGDFISLDFGQVGKRFSLGLALAVTAAAAATDTAVAVAGVQISGTTA